jgi:hypothetical protein
MAGPSVIGALRVVLGADTALLDKGLKDAEGGLARFASSMKTASIAAAAGFAAALTGVGVAVMGALKDADKLNKLSQSVGLSVEELSKLKFAAELSDISLEQLGVSLVKLSKNMSAIAAGGTGPAAEAFKALGISVRNADGTMKSSSDVMSEVAGKFENLKDGANKTALAVAMFGKAGAAMIPLLNGGKKALEEAKQEAEELGLVVSKKTAVAAEAFNDNLTRLHKVLNGVWLKVAEELAPSLADLSTKFVQLVKDGGLVKTSADLIATAFKGIFQEAMAVSLSWTRLGAEWVAFKKVFTTTGSIKEAWNEFLETGRETQRLWASLRASFESDPLGNTTDALAAFKMQQAGVNKELKDAPAIASGAKNALQSYLDSQAKAVASQLSLAASIGQDVGQREKLKVAMEAEAIAKANHIALNAKLKASIDAAGEAAAAAAIKVKGAQVTEEMKTAAVQYNDILEQNKQLFDAGAISADTYGRATRDAAVKAGAAWDIAGASIAGSFQKIAGSFGKENSRMAKAAKAFGLAQAIISMWTGAAKALELPFPANMAAWASVLATGAGAVAAIKSTNVPAMKSGGSFTVPGGMGGGDRTRMAMDLEPGEQVDVWRPGDGNSDPRRGGGSAQTIAVQMTGDVFNRDMLRNLFDKMNEMTADGYRLKFA